MTKLTAGACRRHSQPPVSTGQLYVFVGGGFKYLEPQKTIVLIGKGLVLGGWPSKIEVIWVTGMYIFYFHPYQGEMILQMGWNHQLDIYFLFFLAGQQRREDIITWLGWQFWPSHSSISIRSAWNEGKGLCLLLMGQPYALPPALSIFILYFLKPSNFHGLLFTFMKYIYIHVHTCIYLFIYTPTTWWNIFCPSINCVSPLWKTTFSCPFSVRKQSSARQDVFQPQWTRSTEHRRDQWSCGPMWS